MRRGIVFALPLPLFFVSAALLAQVTSSSIFGTVTDTTGAVVPGVEIKVTQQETNFTRTVLADESGKYLFNALPLGTYRVEATAQGFKKFSQIGIVLEVNRNARVDPVIEVGGVTETVSITADAPLINTTDASVGHTVDNKEILTLPLVNRDLYTLLTLTPGVDQADSTNPLAARPRSVWSMVLPVEPDRSVIISTAAITQRDSATRVTPFRIPMPCRNFASSRTATARSLDDLRRAWWTS
jgi:Carboxypeptidase regulatory-like domain